MPLSTARKHELAGNLLRNSAEETHEPAEPRPRKARSPDGSLGDVAVGTFACTVSQETPANPLREEFDGIQISLPAFARKQTPEIFLAAEIEGPPRRLNR